MSDNFYRTYIQMFSGIQLCIENNLLFPSISLIYSTIDSFAWIAYGDISVRERFVRWVDEFMYTKKKLDPKAIDLYSARCAILHTLTPNSDLSNQYKAKIVAYTWGNADVSLGNKAVEIMNNETIVFVHVNDLFDALTLGVENFINSDSFGDESLQRVKEHFGDLSKDMLDEFISLNAEKGKS